jgi:hypothetical protein
MTCLKKIRKKGIDLGNEFMAELITVIQFEFRIAITMRRMLVTKRDATVNLHVSDPKTQFLTREVGLSY